MKGAIYTKNDHQLIEFENAVNMINAMSLFAL